MNMEQRPAQTDVDCAAMGELISAYIDDELAPHELPSFGHHMRACSACATTLERAAAQKTLLRRSEPYWPEVVPGPDFASRLSAAISKAGPPSAMPAGRFGLPAFWSTAAAVAMTAVLAVSAALLVGRDTRDDRDTLARDTRTQVERSYAAADGNLDRYLSDHALEAAGGSFLSDTAETLELAAYVP